MKIFTCKSAILLLLMILLVACGGTTEPETTEPATSEETTEETTTDPVEEEEEVMEEAGPTELIIFTQQGSTWDMETNWFSNHAEEMFNIDFDWQTTTWDATAAKEARQISLASGDYPEVYMLIPWVDYFSQVELVRYGNQGVILPLNDLIAEHAPNIQQAFDDFPWFRALVTAPDGNIYGLTQLIECFHCSYGLQMWVNSSWLDALGLEQPTTTEEFHEVLRAFKEQDPNGNGEADEIPLSGSSQFLGTLPYPYLLMAYTYYPIADNVMEVPLVIEDGGAVVTAATKDETRAGLQWIAQMYEEGLIDPGAFTQNQEGLQQLGNNAESQLLGAVPSQHPRVFVSDPDYLNDYDAIPPLVGPDGQQNAFYGASTSAGATFVLTNKASEADQIAAIKLVDFMFSTEGQLEAYWGEEGVDWRAPQEGDVAVNAEQEPLFAEIPPESGTSHTGWQPIAQYYQPRAWRDGWIVGEDVYDPANYARRLQVSAEMYETHAPDEVFPYWALWLDETIVDEAAQLHTNLGDYIGQATLQFIIGDLDINDDGDWQDFQDTLAQLGLERYLEINQAAYDQYVATLESE